MGAFALIAEPAWADPPSWAPAHGYRGKHKKKKSKYYDSGYVMPRAPTASTQTIKCNRELVGGLLGGGAGALIGSRFGKGTGRLVATAAGTVVGFLVGGSIGRQMDSEDQSCVANVLESAPTGQTVAWQNPDNGRRYEVTPIETRTDRNNRYCREYTARTIVDGRSETVHGTACRQPDGAWQIVDGG